MDDDEKLNNCQVVIENCLFKIPISMMNAFKMDSSIKGRRHSIRLMDKGIPSMKESSERKSKKRQKPVVQKPVASTDVAPTDTDNNSSQLELSDNDIVQMLGDFATFIEDGVWNATPKTVFSIDDVTGTDATQSQSDKVSSSTSSNMDRDHDYSVLLPQPTPQTSQTQTLVAQKRSVYTETEPPVFYSTSCQTDSVQRSSVLTQTDHDQRSQSTQTCLDHSSISAQTSFENHSTTSTNTDDNIDMERNGLKRKNPFNNSEPTNCQIFKNSKISEHSANHKMGSERSKYGSPSHRKYFGIKTPKCTKNSDMYFGRPSSTSSANREDFGQTKYSNGNMDSVRPKHKSVSSKFSKRASILPQNYSQTKTLQRQSSTSKFELMKKEVFSVLKRPCLKFLKYEHCGPNCKYNHFLPPSGDVAVTIQNWSNEEIHFLYLTYVQRYKMCHQMYFDVICNAFVEKRSPDNIIATIKDCELLSLESQFIVILFSLKKYGYSDDDALFEICSRTSRSRNAINEILKVIVTFKMANFKRTIALLSKEMEVIEFDSYFANEILKQAVEIDTLDVILVNFCCSIIRKYNAIVDTDCMKNLLSKM